MTANHSGAGLARASFTRRGGLISAAVGVGLTVLISAWLMRNALQQATQEHHRNLGALLVSTCQAAVALEDDEIVVENIAELAPQLGDLLAVTVLDVNGRVITRWRRTDSFSEASSVETSLTIAGLAGEAIGSISLRLSTRRAATALEQLWLSLGTVGLLSLAIAGLASHFLSKELDEKNRLEGEFNIAESIQTSLLPKNLHLNGAELAAQMVPASEVGGDYYDVIPVQNGGWICVGDVVGHGLPAGLAMLMMQSGLATALMGNEGSNPAAVISQLNRALFENSQRTGGDQYATLVVARYSPDGILHFAGGHLDLILVSARRNTTVMIPTPGPFVALEPDLEVEAIEQSRLQLEPGDLLVFYTDGITEARNAEGEMFGPGRLCRIVTENRNLPVAKVAKAIVSAAKKWGPEQEDDFTVLVLRHRGLALSG